mmetsp:Transcript_21095/g.56784  ORF Transcript_21095/g.56784 Transcript_21095/m.56784 type:complete len:234 (+) Transcript_21095:595-1296(+)
MLHVPPRHAAARRHRRRCPGCEHMDRSPQPAARPHSAARVRCFRGAVHSRVRDAHRAASPLVHAVRLLRRAASRTHSGGEGSGGGALPGFNLLRAHHAGLPHRFLRLQERLRACDEHWTQHDLSGVSSRLAGLAIGQERRKRRNGHGAIGAARQRRRGFHLRLEGVVQLLDSALSASRKAARQSGPADGAAHSQHVWQGPAAHLAGSRKRRERPSQRDPCPPGESPGDGAAHP